MNSDVSEELIDQYFICDPSNNLILACKNDLQTRVPTVNKTVLYHLQNFAQIIKLSSSTI